MVALLFFLLNLLVSPFRSISRLEAENAALRRQLIVVCTKNSDSNEAVMKSTEESM